MVQTFNILTANVYTKDHTWHSVHHLLLLHLLLLHLRLLHLHLRLLHLLHAHDVQGVRRLLNGHRHGHGRRQGLRDLESLQLHSDHLASQRELVQVHLAVAVDVRKTPEKKTNEDQWIYEWHISKNTFGTKNLKWRLRSISDLYLRVTV